MLLESQLQSEHTDMATPTEVGDSLMESILGSYFFIIFKYLTVSALYVDSCYMCQKSVHPLFYLLLFLKKKNRLLSIYDVTKGVIYMHHLTRTADTGMLEVLDQQSTDIADTSAE